MSEWNPRYETFCRIHGVDPEAISKGDGTLCVGIVDFMSWIVESKTRCAKVRPDIVDSRNRVVDQDAWTKWLDENGIEVSRLRGAS